MTTNGDDMLSKFERYPLTFGPTHIEKLQRLSRHLGELGIAEPPVILQQSQHLEVDTVETSGHGRIFRQ